jgi:hypothetical protein
MGTYLEARLRKHVSRMFRLLNHVDEVISVPFVEVAMYQVLPTRKLKQNGFFLVAFVPLYFYFFLPLLLSRYGIGSGDLSLPIFLSLTSVCRLICWI